MEEIDEISWHDSQIVSVLEKPSKDQLIFNVEYPIDYEKSKYELKSIIFEEFFLYEIDEIPFDGNPTILDADVVKEVGSPFVKDGYFKVKIKTNAGDRFVTAKRVSLSESNKGI